MPIVSKGLKSVEHLGVTAAAMVFLALTFIAVILAIVVPNLFRSKRNQQYNFDDT